MNRPAIADPESQDRTGHNVRLGVVALVVVLGTAVALTFLTGLSSGPSTVPRITFENPTVYTLDIEVSDGTGPHWTSAGSVAKQSTADVEEVIDQGDLWVFRFDSQGSTGGELRLSRTELEASGWHVSVPPEVGTRLRESGAPPTP